MYMHAVKNISVWIYHVATDHASIEYEDKGLSRIIILT